MKMNHSIKSPVKKTPVYNANSSGGGGYDPLTYGYGPLTYGGGKYATGPLTYGKRQNHWSPPQKKSDSKATISYCSDGDPLQTRSKKLFIYKASPPSPAPPPAPARSPTILLKIINCFGVISFFHRVFAWIG